ncbi:MAG: hypothetical protein R3E44_16350 [Paracoccaceae bacterium]
MPSRSAVPDPVDDTLTARQRRDAAQVEAKNGAAQEERDPARDRPLPVRKGKRATAGAPW